MKKNKVILFFTLILIIIAASFILTRKKGTIKEELKDFAIRDTAFIDKIFLADKAGNKVTLTKIKSGYWKVNNKYIARNDAINTLLYTMSRLEVKSPVAKAAHNNVVKRLASNATKVEIYEGDKLLKVYYVGGETQDQLGTFMLLENSSVPFVMHIPGFNGYLSTRYFTKEQEWREHSVFDYSYDEIQSITVEYPANPELSFNINKTGENQYSFNPYVKSVPLMVDTLRLKTYVSFYQNINFEGFPKNITSSQKDSIINSQPQAIVSLTDTKGGKNTVKLFSKEISARSKMQEDISGEPLKYDLDRMYALINDGEDFVVVQYYVFDKLLKTQNDFKAFNQLEKVK